jgi:oxygen-independent coproporphyrinogen-3 oxidase
MHNTRYWRRRPYLGLGPSAASQLAEFRWTETGLIAAWTEGRGDLDFQELDAAEILSEVPLLGLRLHAGLDWRALRDRADALNLRPLCDGWEARLRALATEDLVIWEGDRVRLGARGMLMSNGILGMFA